MREFGEFARKFSWRVLQIVGVVAVIQSVPVQYVAHSPALKFVGQWLGPVIVLGLVTVEVVIQKSGLDAAKFSVVRLPYQFSSHLDLAVAAARLNDYYLAEAEYSLAKKLGQETTSSRVLGESADQVERTIFPKKFVEQEIVELKKIMGQRPGYRDLWLMLALKYWQIGDTEQAKEFWDEARILDPNSETVIKTGRRIETE